MVGVVAHHERVVANDLESVPRVEALRPVVFAPHADPQGARAVALEPFERRLEEEGAAPRPLVALQDVEALDFPVAGRDVGVGQVRGACGHVPDWGMGRRRGRGLVNRFRRARVVGGGGVGPREALVGFVLEEEPRRPVRILEFGAQDVGCVGLVEEGLQVGGGVEVAEGLREAGAREGGERLGVCGGGAADHGCLSSVRYPS